MKTLVEKILMQTGVDAETAKDVLLVIAAHIKEQHPLMQSFVDAVLETGQLYKAPVVSNFFRPFLPIHLS